MANTIDRKTGGVGATFVQKSFLFTLQKTRAFIQCQSAPHSGQPTTFIEKMKYITKKIIAQQHIHHVHKSDLIMTINFIKLCHLHHHNHRNHHECHRR